MYPSGVINRRGGVFPKQRGALEEDFMANLLGATIFLASSFEESFDRMLLGSRPERPSDWLGETSLADDLLDLEESERLDELAIRDISRDAGLPFKICVKDPETNHKNDPHAHLFGIGKKGKDLGMRLELYPATPQSADDIRDAFPGRYAPIPDEWKPLILAWAKKRNKVSPKISNWEILWIEWSYSVNK